MSILEFNEAHKKLLREKLNNFAKQETPLNSSEIRHTKVLTVDAVLYMYNEATIEISMAELIK